MNIFIGVEAEGHEKGIETLFIGNVPIIDVNKLTTFLISKKINRIYFGANNFRQLPLWFDAFIKVCPESASIIAEIKDPKDAKKRTRRINFVLYIDIEQIQEIKIIEGNVLTWTRLKDRMSRINCIDSLIYKEDKEVII